MRVMGGACKGPGVVRRRWRDAGGAAFGFAALACLWSGIAAAQIVLPGAVAPTPEGASQPTIKRVVRPRDSGPAMPAPVVVPTPTSLAGKTLFLNGGPSQVTFAAADKQVTVARLTLAGERISNTRGDCQVSAEATPIPVTALGRPLGVERIQLSYPACPIAFDVLDGAVLVDATQGACTFAAADCRVDPSGLWGPPAGDIGPNRDKEIERARGHAEAAVRANYKALTASTKDRPTVMGYAREQAQFSSTREEICRTYAGEGVHGYCASKLTEARVAQLRQEVGTALVAKAERKARRKGGKAATP